MVGNEEAVRDKGLRPYVAEATIGAAPVALVADSVLLTRWIITADEANLNPVLLGTADEQTYPLKAGTSVDGTYFGHDPSLVWASGTATDVLHLAGCR